jgi:hypothetical protein
MQSYDHSMCRKFGLTACPSNSVRTYMAAEAYKQTSKPFIAHKSAPSHDFRSSAAKLPAGQQLKPRSAIPGLFGRAGITRCTHLA